MYGIDLSVQFENLMPALGLGFLLGFVHDIFMSVVTCSQKNKKVIFVTDFLFITGCTVISYLMALAVNYGHIRLYLIAAEVLGFAVYKFTVGILICRVMKKIVKVFRVVFDTVTKPLILLKNKFHNRRKINSKFKKNLEIIKKNT